MTVDGSGAPTVPDAGLELAGSSLRGALEAVLLVAEEPLAVERLAAGLAVPAPVVRDALEEIRADLRRRESGIALREIGGGWRFYTAEEYADTVGRFLLDGQSGRLSQAALETLAVIAYQQPISRARVAAVRGVNVDGVVRTLSVRGLITEQGTEEGSGAVLYGTTALLLEKLGLRDLGELPPLAPLLPDAGGLSEEDAVRPPGRSRRAENGEPAGGDPEEAPPASGDPDD